MDFSKIKEYGCEGIISNSFYVIYDESSLALCRDDDYILFGIEEIYELMRILKQAETTMLENYKSMNLEEKHKFCKDHDIKYSTLQKIMTLRSGE